MVLSVVGFRCIGPRVCITDRTRVPFLLGLTGNIACGKSSVGQLLTERFGADYVDADRLVHALYASGTPETRAIADRFGTALVKADGTIDRRRLGDAVLGDRAALRDLERILDPGVRQAIADRISQTRATVVVLDAIRLIEAGTAARCDAVWVVVCDPDAQMQRLQTSRGLSAEQAALRIAAQSPAEEKLRHATAVITNHGTLEALAAQVEAAWNSTVQPHLGGSH
jgi:dephospho-CoA kinase